MGVVPLALKAAIELNIFQILANAGQQSMLTASQIVSHLSTTNPTAAPTLDRVLRLLASYSILSSTQGSNGETCYGLTPMCDCLIPTDDGTSCAPMILTSFDKDLMEGWHYLKDAVLEGCVPFFKAHGKTSFEYFNENPSMSKLFNETMFGLSMNYMKDILENYKGFEGLKEIVDVGGGIGASLRLITAKYPHIRGTNFDLPYVVANAAPLPGMLDLVHFCFMVVARANDLGCVGVKHVAGDMFEKVPSGEAIFIKSVLHDWDDERCVKILKNCWKALPDSGMVILVEFVLQSDTNSSKISRSVMGVDLMMLACNDGGKERSLEEFEAVANAAGFPAIKSFQCSSGMTVMELHKDPLN
ncbi:hypothetical protein ACLOJK_029215 [Asimina triloba]